MSKLITLTDGYIKAAIWQGLEKGFFPVDGGHSEISVNIMKEIHANIYAEFLAIIPEEIRNESK